MANKKAAQKKEAEPTELPECFVIMPISDREPYSSGHFGHVYKNIIKPSCEMAGFKAIRADENTSTNVIQLEILKQLLDAPMAICDLTSHNPNVMFELGIRQAFDKPVLLIRDEDTKPIFDIGPLRAQTYKKAMVYHEVEADQECISKALKTTFKDAKDNNNTNSLVTLLSMQKAQLKTGVDSSDVEAHLLNSNINYMMNKISEIHHEISSSGMNKDSVRKTGWWERSNDSGKIRIHSHNDSINKIYISFLEDKEMFQNRLISDNKYLNKLIITSQSLSDMRQVLLSPSLKLKLDDILEEIQEEISALDIEF